MRDDVSSIIAALSRHYTTKLRDVNLLLLSEQDKLHFLKSGNIEKIFELVEADNGIIDAIDLSDYEISRAEDGLARIIGVSRDDLYVLLGGISETADLIALRTSTGSAIRQIYERRELLTERMEAEHRLLRENIDGISRLNRLKRIVGE